MNLKKIKSAIISVSDKSNLKQILFNEKGKIVQQKNIYHGYQSKVRVTK